MARSLLTLAAAVTAALPGADVVGVRSLSADSNDRYNSVVATLQDGSEVVLREPVDDGAERELAAEIIALGALTAGVREQLSFQAPRPLGRVNLGDSLAHALSFIDGYQVDAAEVPPGRGIATALGTAIADIHSLPASIVRGAGLPERSAATVRSSVEELLERAGASGKLPVRLMTRWREAVDADRLWAFQSTVSLGGTQSTSFIFSDDVAGDPRIAGVVDWHGLAIDDPAADLRWVSSAPEAATDVFDAYTGAAHRAPDAGLRVRARLHAELEFARWLVHGLDAHRSDIVGDAVVLLESLADGLEDDRLLAGFAVSEGAVDDALDVIGRVPEGTGAAADTSMHTDAYDPREFETLRESSRAETVPPGQPPTHDDTAPIDDVSDDGVPAGERGRNRDGDLAERLELPSKQPADDPAGATVPFDMDEFIATERATPTTDDDRASHGEHDRDREVGA